MANTGVSVMTSDMCICMHVCVCLYAQESESIVCACV